MNRAQPFRLCFVVLPSVICPSWLSCTTNSIRSDLWCDSARKVAVDVLLDRRLFMLDAERYDAFVLALDSPPAPGPKLRALLRRAPAWET